MKFQNIFIKMIIISIFIMSLTYIFPLEVDINEIKTNKNIQFINFEGQHFEADPYWDIRAIGYKLAKVKKRNEILRYHMKYSIIHVVDDTDTDKFDADILSIDEHAMVDHIRNIRLIMAAYLQRKYGYKTNDAFLLSTFITYYNALHRGNIDYFSNKYKDIVLEHINENNAGISTKYYEWPGGTKILIPLTDEIQKGSISALDTAELTEQVIDELKQREDKGLEDRKKITEFQEKEIIKKNKEIEKEKKEIEKEKKKIEKKEAAIEKEKKELSTITDEKKKEKKEKQIEEQEKTIKEKKDTIKKQEESVKKKETKLTSKKEKVTNEKKEIKEDEIRTKINKDPIQFKEDLKKESEELERREEKLKEKEDELRSERSENKIIEDKFYYMKNMAITTEGHYNNELYIIDAKTRKIIKKSPYDKVTGKTYHVFKEGVVIISYTDTHDSPHHLVLLDLDDLEEKVTGNENVFWRSFIKVKNNSIYAIIKEQSNYFLGKFDPSLVIQAKSVVKIAKDSFISFYDDLVYINSANKEILVLNKSDLSLVDSIKP